jgi:transcriptional regulator with XRE-family HTH domain
MSKNSETKDDPRDRKQLAKRLGDLLQRFREEQGRSASAVAREAGMSRSYLSYVENGHFGEIGIDKLTRLISVLGLSADAVLQEAGYLPSQPQGFPEPKAYLATVYGLAPNEIEHATAFLDFLAAREHASKR